MQRSCEATLLHGLTYLMQCTMLLLCSKAIEFHFLLHQETMEDPKVKQHLKVLFLSTTLPGQSQSIYSFQTSTFIDLRSNLLCLSQLTYKLAKCTLYMANIWFGVNQIYQLSNQLFVQSQINFVRIERRHT
jgi:hypothetical protein